MKKIIYVCILALLAISFGCEKEEIIIEEQNEVIKDEIQYQSRQNDNNNSTGIFRLATYLNEIPPGTETINIYLDMDLLEAQYLTYPSNPPIIGHFNEFYRDHWLGSFTIYTIAYSSALCEYNEEKWTVNKAEYMNYLEVWPYVPIPNGPGGTNTTIKPRPLTNSTNDAEEEDLPTRGVFWLGESNCFN